VLHGMRAVSRKVEERIADLGGEVIANYLDMRLWAF
jgi:hypothetical protein